MMHTSIKRFAIGWAAVFLFTISCYAVTQMGIAAAWISWYLGLFSTIALLAISVFASLGFLTWAVRPGNIWTLLHGDVQLPDGHAPRLANEHREAA